MNIDIAGNLALFIYLMKNSSKRHPVLFYVRTFLKRMIFIYVYMIAEQKSALHCIAVNYYGKSYYYLRHALRSEWPFIIILLSL